jgi:gamma-glutamyltranspeptidase/glutathione hydrolase
MRFDPTHLPYLSARYPVYAGGGMVAASSPQAAAAGLETMRMGGNAVDAAVAAAMTLTVVEPTANGIGSDAFALVWMEGEKKLYGLNGSGWSPKDLTPDKAMAQTALSGRMPVYGWLPVMVPGAPKTWAALSRRFGRLSLPDTARPAVRYAREGYPAAPNLSGMWKRAMAQYRSACTGSVFEPLYHTFMPNGRTPEPGDRVYLPDHADTLEKIAVTSADAFYRGELAERILADSREFGGFFCSEDFAEYDVTWVDPLSVHYRGYDVCEIPPNGQGIVALMALNILKTFDFTEKEHVDTFHRQWEAMKIAFADGLYHITDPACMRTDSRTLLTPAYGASRSALINGQAQTYMAGTPPSGGTVYLCTADGDGNMVSYIQSNYMGFGSGVIIRGTGISMNNRGYDFSLNPEDINCLAPRKKTYHTIIPGFLMQRGEAVGPFGVMGGYMQPQGHVQTVMNLVDFGLNPQQALDAPRWQWTKGMHFLVESAFSRPVAHQLSARGHEVERVSDHTTFGRGQMILRLPNGALAGGTEYRTDGHIACF